MPVLADAEHGEVGRILCEQRRVPAALSRGVLGLAAQPMELAEVYLVYQAVEQEAAEGLRRAVLHPQILVEVKALDLRPVDTRGFGEFRQELVLRRGGGEDADGATPLALQAT